MRSLELDYFRSVKFLERSVKTTFRFAFFLGTTILVNACNFSNTQPDAADHIYKTAEAITVLIEGQNPGSGFIVASNDNTHYILTAHHVVKSRDEYDIHTPDGEIVRIQPDEYNSRVQKLADIDLAIIKIESDNSYLVPEMRTDGVEETSVLYVAGYPGNKNTSKVKLTEGLAVSNDLAVEPLEQGYGLIYNNPTLPGMSGGPVLDELGRVVGIHGRAEQVRNDSEWEKTGFNLGIPIWSYREIILASLELRLATSNRLETIEDFFSSIRSKLNSGCEPIRDIKYSSMSLQSPNNNTLFKFEGELKSYKHCQDGVSTPQTKNVFLLIEDSNGVEKKEFYSSSSEIQQYFSSASAFVVPVSFSPEGQYFIVKELFDGGPTEPGYSYSIVELNNKKITPIAPCPNNESEYALSITFNGFVSSEKISFICLMVNEKTGPGELESIFSVEDNSILSVNRNISTVEEYPSYGSLSSTYEVRID